MSFAQSIIVFFIMPVLSVIRWLIIIEIVLTWLIAFGVVQRGGMVSQIAHGLSRFTDPILDPFRRVIPPMGGLDLSPIVAILLLLWVERYLVGGLLLQMVG
ncbi:YggT family protein [uncultured Algimonas sp.]|uniref:YggT family protein n=1 Tax=uncultured Algimonas sp. TaxID=1547920 RepID=UPI0026387AD5|nr:YggT family protein [uncultured Algimonas sp.]